MRPLPTLCRRHSRVTGVAALALLVSAALLRSAYAYEGEVATITAVEGLAEVVAPGSTRAVPARVDMRVAAGSTVRTKANGRLELQFDDRSILRLDKNTQIQILTGREQRGVLVSLGNLWAKIQSALGASKFSIQTPTVVAGVRGTIVRAEVTEEEAAIAVDEGEVEVTLGEEPQALVLQQHQRARAGRGAPQLLQERFDPNARQQWEFWTDPLVQQRVQELHETVADAVRATTEAQRQATAMHQALATDARAVLAIRQRIAGANAIVDGVVAAMKSPPPPSPPGPGRRGGRRLPPKPPTKPDLLARLVQAERIYTEALPLIARGRESVQDHGADLGALREALQAQQATQAELQAELATFKSRREIDPHWGLFRRRFEEASGQHGKLGQALAAAQPLLATEVPNDLGDDPTQMRSIAMRLHWSLQVLGALEAQANQRLQQIEALRAELMR